ncbi:MAG: phospholipase D-like domain-containing protein [Chloroflexota bacterium]
MTKTNKTSRTASLGSTLLMILLVAGLLLLDWLGVIELNLLDGGSGPVVEEPGGAWYQVYFTAPRYPDEDEYHHDGLDERLATAIGEAQKSVDVAAYDLDLTRVTQALITAHNEGLRVRVVVDTDNVDLEPVRDLEKAGIVVVDDERSAIMHHKFVVIDGATVWTGSWNLTDNGTYRNNNNVVVVQSVRLAENYTAEFEEMFQERSFGPGSAANTPHPELNIGGVQVENYFAPEDQVAHKLVPLLQGAQSSIRFMAFSFTHDDIGQAMRDRAVAGVNVQGVFEDRQVDDTFSEYGRLKQVKGVQVRLDGNPYVMHHKVIIIDEQTVVLGSYNLSNSADEKNDENVLIVHDAEFAAHYLAEFQRIWAEAQ